MKHPNAPLLKRQQHAGAAMTQTVPNIVETTVTGETVAFETTVSPIHSRDVGAGDQTPCTARCPLSSRCLARQATWRHETRRSFGSRCRLSATRPRESNRHTSGLEQRFLGDVIIDPFTGPEAPWPEFEALAAAYLKRTACRSAGTRTKYGEPPSRV